MALTRERAPVIARYTQPLFGMEHARAESRDNYMRARPSACVSTMIVTGRITGCERAGRAYPSYGGTYLLQEGEWR